MVKEQQWGVLDSPRLPDQKVQHVRIFLYFLAWYEFIAL